MNDEEKFCQRCVTTGRAAGKAIHASNWERGTCHACELELALLGGKGNPFFEGEMGRLYGTRIIDDMRKQAKPIQRFRQLLSGNKGGKKKRKPLIFNK